MMLELFERCVAKMNKYERIIGLVVCCFIASMFVVINQKLIWTQNTFTADVHGNKDIFEDEKPNTTEPNLEDIFDPDRVLTMFTTFSNNTDRLVYETNTINNWAWISEQSDQQMKCHSFYTNYSSILLKNEVDLNPYWSMSQIEETNHGLPVVKHMFLEVSQQSESFYIGYSNSDILYDSLLLQTVKAVHEFHNKKYRNEPQLLMVGRRTDVNGSLIGTNVTDDTHIEYLVKQGTLHPGNAIDYFITNRRKHPWEKFLDVIVGRPGWDNYMLYYALDEGVPTYDISNTVHALHQTYFKKLSRGSQGRYPDLNTKLIDKQKAGLLYRATKTGITSNTNYYTKWKNKNILIEQSQKERH